MEAKPTLISQSPLSSLPNNPRYSTTLYRLNGITFRVTFAPRGRTVEVISHPDYMGLHQAAIIAERAAEQVA